MTAPEWRGTLWGVLAVASFSLTLPATRAAISGLDFGFVAIGRGIGAGLLAAAILAAARQPVPGARDLLALCGVATGVVIGFPFLTAFAMMHVPASHGAIVVGLLPLSTAVAGVVLAGERPSLGFWAASLAGTAFLLAFILDGTYRGIGSADLALIGAVASAACGYALGGRLATRLGGWQVICWALVVSLPVLGLAAALAVDWPRASVPLSAWAGFAYITLISQLLGFFAWYHGLAMGGIARVSQTQLLQLFMTLAASSLLLGEPIEPRMLAYGAAVVASAAIGTRLRVGSRQPMPGPLEQDRSR
jgi:drug/metabolite transporter (DMT)-like permease